MITVKIELTETSQHVRRDNVVNSYTKGPFYCVFREGQIVEKYPLANIWRVTEDYGPNPTSSPGDQSEQGQSIPTSSVAMLLPDRDAPRKRWIGCLTADSPNLRQQLQSDYPERVSHMPSALNLGAINEAEAERFFVSYFWHLFGLYLLPTDFSLYSDGSDA